MGESPRLVAAGGLIDTKLYLVFELTYDAMLQLYLRRILVRCAQVILLSFEGDDGEASKYRGVSLRAHPVADPACFRPGSLQCVLREY